MTQRQHQRLRNPSLSARRMYAQVLARRIYANDWHDPSTRLDYGDTPPFNILGGGMIPTPSILQATTSGHAASGVPAARITLSNPHYYATILELPDPQYEAWMTWLQPRFDKHGHPATPSRLFRSNGKEWIRDEHTSKSEQDAAVAILEAATILRESVDNRQ